MLPGAYITITVSGVTSIFFSPSLYVSVSTAPPPFVTSLPTVPVVVVVAPTLPTVPLVIVLFGL